MEGPTKCRTGPWRGPESCSPGRDASPLLTPRGPHFPERQFLHLHLGNLCRLKEVKG